MVKCGTCRADFNSITLLKLHLPSHGGLRFICGEDECGRYFSVLDTYLRHLKSAHSCVTNSSYTDKSLTAKNATSSVEDHEYPPEDSDILNNDTNIEGNDSVPDLSVADFKTTYSKSIEILVAKLYSNPSIPRNFVQTLIDDFELFLNGGFVEVLEAKVLKALVASSVLPSTTEDIKNIFNCIKNPFKGLHSDYMRMEYFKANSFYVAPVTYIISQCRPKTFNTAEGVIVKHVKTTGQFVPFRHVLKNLFELPGALSSTLKYVEYLKNAINDAVISNVIQGHRWKTIVSKFQDTDIVLPVDFYYDDVEPNAALGAHSEKLGAGYIMLPALPPACRSKLENIFLVLLIDADDRKSCTPGKTSYNSEVFKPVIKELNFLEEKGIWCQTDDLGEKQIFFVLNLIRGDNLGMHGILGFAEGFTANYPCVICRAPKELTCRLTRHDDSLLRNMTNYNNDVVRADCSLTGIKEACVFNKVRSYHVVQSHSVDNMHDGAEGMCHYVLIPIIKHCVDSKYFSIPTLNSRLFFFDYGPSDSDNKLQPIADDFATKSKLKGTASEIFTLVRIFGVLVGDLVPEDDEYWRLYKLHKEIIEICQANELPLEMNEQLDLLVHEHHCLFLKLIGRLPPKGHHYTHYGFFLRENGSPNHASSMRGEAQHRQIVTKYARAITSRRNLPLSVAIKNQLSMCFRFLTKPPLIPQMVCGPGEVIDLCDHLLYTSIKSKLPNCLKKCETVQRVNWVEVYGTVYKPRVVLVCDVINDIKFKFAKVVDIFIVEGKALFICQSLTNLGYEEHVGGYGVKYSNSHVCIFHEDLFDHTPLYDFQMCSGERYVVPKYYI